MKIQLLSSIILLSCKNTAALYTINIYLTQFHNPGQTLLNGKSCDKPTRYDQCEHRFQMCLDFPDGNKDDHSQCRIRGPFDIKLNKKWKAISSDQPWQGNILVKVNVTDKDSWNSEELVDELSSIFKLESYRNINAIDYNNVDETMRGNHTTLALRIAVFCNDKWKGPQCDCHDTKQNYYCGHDGNKLCYKGWYGPQCDVECTSADGINEHYECSPNGTKACHIGYYGEYCDKECNSTDDDTGHYTCDQNGNKTCNSNWCSEDCDVFCGEVQTAAAEIDPGMISSTSDGPDPNPRSSDEEIESKQWKPNLIPIIGGVAGAMALLIIGFTLFFCQRKKRHHSAQTDTTPMQTMSTSGVHDNNSRMNEGLCHIATPAGPGYEDCFPNLAARKPRDCAAASSSNDVYAVPDKKTKTRKQGDLADVSDDMLIVDNELYGAASKEKQTQAHAGDISDDMLIVDNELYGPTSEVKGTQSHKVGASANISDDMLIVDNELYG